MTVTPLTPPPLPPPSALMAPYSISASAACASVGTDVWPGLSGAVRHHRADEVMSPPIHQTPACSQRSTPHPTPHPPPRATPVPAPDISLPCQSPLDQVYRSAYRAQRRVKVTLFTIYTLIFIYLLPEAR